MSLLFLARVLPFGLLMGLSFVLGACASKDSKPLAVGTVTESSDRELASPRQAPPRWSERKLYFGRDSSEVEMTFSFYAMAAESRPTPERAEEIIEAQVAHLFGTMPHMYNFKAIPKRGHTLSNVRVSQAPGGFRIDYDYKGIIVVDNSAGNSTIPIALPIDPMRIYDQGTENGRRRPNPCTDPRYDYLEYHWYFWNPMRPGCGLKEGVHWAQIPAKIRRLPNTVTTYPEYARLVHNGEIRFDVMLGLDKPYNNSYNPNKSYDINAENWEAIARTLKGLGFKSRVWSNAEVSAYGRPSFQERGLPWVEEYVKQTPRARIVVRAIFGNSELDSGRVFQAFLKDALERSSVFVYAGHSGLGKNMDINKIEKLNNFKIRLPTDRYQIYFMNGCSTYSYYNTMYFKRKETPQDPKGTKNLDIITNGLATYFWAIDPSTNALIRAVDAWAMDGRSMSWQQMINQMDTENLIGINGDEDNPRTPQ